MKLRIAPALLVAALAFAFAFGPETAPDAPLTVTTTSAAGHTLVIRYLDTRGDYRRANVTVRSESGARTPWRGRLSAIHLEGLRPLGARDQATFRRQGFARTAEFLSSGHTTGSNIIAPSPENLKRAWFQGARGSTASFRIPTRGQNPSTQGDGDKEPDTQPGDDGGGDDDGGDDSGDDDGGDDGGDDEGCTGGVDCVGLYNPWTCTCEPEVVDPWAGTPRTEGPTTQIGF